MSIDETWKYSYADNIEAQLAHEGSQLRAHVRVDTPAKSEGYRPQMVMGNAESTERTTKYEKKDPTELDFTGRWIVPRDWDVGPYFEDNIDRVRNGIDVTGAYTMESAEAIRRRHDRLLGDAFFASAKTGKNGTGTDATFDTTNMRVAHGSTGMSVAKLITARTKLKKQHVNLKRETPRIAFTEQEYEDLMNDILATSREFTGRTVLDTGEMEKYVGFTFVEFSSEFWTYTSEAGVTRCPFWVPSGILLADWGMMEAPTIRRATEYRGEPWEVYAQFKASATRLFENKVGEILAQQS